MVLASDSGKHWLLTGSTDSTVVVWEVNPDPPVFGEMPVNVTPLHTLSGHDATVNCVSCCPEMDLVASGSDDGTIMIHTLREGAYVRTIVFNDFPDAPSRNASRGMNIRSGRVNMLCLSKEGYIVAYSNHGHILHSYSLNSLDVAGPLRRIFLFERLHCMILSEVSISLSLSLK
tara:strand:- start:225 stop:746 length:522 start_codon:yes stop_codon:yes gene_type:complete